jgi:hypothetical protein
MAAETSEARAAEADAVRRRAPDADPMPVEHEGDAMTGRRRQTDEEARARQADVEVRPRRVLNLADGRRGGELLGARTGVRRGAPDGEDGGECGKRDGGDVPA